MPSFVEPIDLDMSGSESERWLLARATGEKVGLGSSAISERAWRLVFLRLFLTIDQPRRASTAAPTTAPTTAPATAPGPMLSESEFGPLGEDASAGAVTRPLADVRSVPVASSLSSTCT